MIAAEGVKGKERRWLVNAVRGKPCCVCRKRNRPTKFTVQHTVPPFKKMLKSQLSAAFM